MRARIVSVVFSIVGVVTTVQAGATARARYLRILPCGARQRNSISGHQHLASARSPTRPG
jgi:hypothetical protein